MAKAVPSRPQTIGTSLLGWLDRVPWWVLVLGALGLMLAYFILSPANVTAVRQVPAGDVQAGGEIGYEISLASEGPAEAVAVTVTEELPQGLTFVSADPEPETQEGSIITWRAPDLSRGETAIIAVVARSDQAGRMSTILPPIGLRLSWRTVSIDILDFLSMGVRVTITVTLYSFIVAVTLGLLAGLGRVSRPPVGLRLVFEQRFVIRGLIRVAIGLGVYYVLAMLVPVLPDFTAGLAVALAAILYLSPVVLHPYTLSTIYIEIFRGVPMLVQVLYLGFVVRPYFQSFASNLAGSPVEFSEFAAAVVGLGLGYGAYLAEVFRAGIQSIHRGQMEAARSLGMSYGQAMRHVVLPQAIRRVLPPLANDGVALLKDSSFVSVLSVADLTRQGRLYMSRTYRAFESWNMVAVSYLILTFLLSGVARAIEKKLSQDERQ
ncbi:MAG: ABC transporter permease subunit [Anaerolineae bacterium]